MVLKGPGLGASRKKEGEHSTSLVVSSVVFPPYLGTYGAWVRVSVVAYLRLLDGHGISRFTTRYLHRVSEY